MLTDLPGISPFTYTERGDYATSPQTPYQLFMRRAPQPHERSAAARAKDADWRMREVKTTEREALLGVLKAHKHRGVEEVGLHDNWVTVGWDGLSWEKMKVWVWVSHVNVAHGVH